MKNGSRPWFFLVALLAAGCASAPADRSDFVLSKKALDGSQEAFLPRQDYLQMVLPYPPVRELYEEFTRQPSTPNLKNRGEAHITVITPPEFAALVKAVSIDEVNEIARAEKIQNSRIEAVCLGSGQAIVDGRGERTYFVVVRALDLVRIRARIYDRYLKNGGANGVFDPNHFYPHVTLGFTKSDLHEQQGVVKGENSCRYKLNIKN